MLQAGNGCWQARPGLQTSREKRAGPQAQRCHGRGWQAAGRQQDHKQERRQQARGSLRRSAAPSRRAARGRGSGRGGRQQPDPPLPHSLVCCPLLAPLCPV